MKIVAALVTAAVTGFGFVPALGAIIFRVSQ